MFFNSWFVFIFGYIFGVDDLVFEKVVLVRLWFWFFIC